VRPKGLKAPVTIDENSRPSARSMAARGILPAASRCGSGRPSGALPLEAEVTKMFDENLARIRAHRNNIHRYRGLLRTNLSDLEREFIEKRMADEQTALDALVTETFPVAFPLPKDPSTSSSRGAAS
jgi:hypothetical protein